MTTWRALLYAAKLAVLIAAGIWLVETPGQVRVDWLGYRIETHIGILILAVLVFAAAVALIYRTPKAVGRKLEENKRRKGYKALTQGMVAVAAGDPGEASRQARRTKGLLNEPPLTLLLSAQAAQLEGDDAAARKYFEAMLENPETRFLGLRGLINQALKSGDDQAALLHLKEAYKLRGDTPWVLESMCEVCERLGDWSGAEQALREAEKRKALPKPEASQRRAHALLERAKHEAETNQTQAALNDVSETLKLDPASVEAVALQAKLTADKGDDRRALKLIEKAWVKSPDERLARAYRDLLSDDKPLERFKRVQKLVSSQSKHLESRVALAEAALEARLWGEARKQLREVIAGSGDTIEARVCLLMAELEESENGDIQAARDWLLRAQSGSRAVARMEEHEVLPRVAPTGTEPQDIKAPAPAGELIEPPKQSEKEDAGAKGAAKTA